jgi:peptidoglycan/LPS O-acetylase OafA/YrhL
MHRLTSTQSLARAAFTGIALFPLVVVILHLVQAGSYHPISQAVSELALGRGGWLMAVAFCSLGTGTLLLALTLRRLEPQPRVASALILASGLLSYVSAFVHADGSGPTTTHGQIHQLVGVVTFILMISGMFALVRNFRRNPEWQPLAAPTRVWAIAAVVAFVLIPVSGSDHFGLAQRVFLALILSWALTVSAHAARRAEEIGAAFEPATSRV